jgi:hypothetical protein
MMALGRFGGIAGSVLVADWRVAHRNSGSRVHRQRSLGTSP